MTQDFFNFDDDDPEDNIPARHDDPETSQNAGKRIRKKNPDPAHFSVKSRQAKLLLLFSKDGYTDTEAALLVVGEDADPGPLQGCRRRCSDLRAAGFIQDTMTRRCNNGTPDDAMVCTITEAGWVALRKLEDTGWSK